ncbi:MAG: maleylacetoacetate isomerase, partial [Myxococcota bacterium]|nr:maleylacetoacetate isomerase [Myxococcota bacterium]
QVPVLQDQLGAHQMTISQSIAIMEYLEEQYPNPSILPTDAKQRFRARQVSEVINSGIQPLQNSSTLKAIEALGQDKKEWAKSWIQQGLDNLETMVRGFPETDFVVSSTPTMADFCLIPQLYNAKRFGCTMAHWTRLRSIQAKCMTLPAFVLSHPENQHDAPADTNPQNDPSHKS